MPLAYDLDALLANPAAARPAPLRFDADRATQPLPHDAAGQSLGHVARGTQHA